jgi:Uma2 family endonuclease
MPIDTGLLNQATLVNGDDDLFEIVNGERIEIASMGAYAGTVASILVHLLNQFALPRKLGWAVSEVLFDLGPGLNERRPDVAFIRLERWNSMTERPQGDPRAWKVVPNLAVEVVSPTNSAEEVETKVLECFTAGVTQVWVIYPRLQRAHVYDSPTNARILTREDLLESTLVLPGFQLLLGDLFDALPPL